VSTSTDGSRAAYPADHARGGIGRLRYLTGRETPEELDLAAKDLAVLHRTIRRAVADLKLDGLLAERWPGGP